VIGVAVARYLHSLNLVVFDETAHTGNCFCGYMPSEPDEAVMILPTGGNPLICGSVHGYDEPVVQVMVRGTHDSRVSETLALAIYNALQGLHNTTLDPGGDAEVYLVNCVSLQSYPASIGTDEKGRHRFSLNFALHVRALTTHRE
jgi:hypothetical protein